MSWELSCESGPVDPNIFGHGATIEGLVLRCQDVAAQGIVHHVRLKVVAKRMLHDRALVEPRDQFGHVPEPGAPITAMASVNATAAMRGRLCMLFKLPSQTSVPPLLSARVSNASFAKGQLHLIMVLLSFCVPCRLSRT
jgi:hypothetical protein